MAFFFLEAKARGFPYPFLNKTEWWASVHTPPHDTWNPSPPEVGIPNNQQMVRIGFMKLLLLIMTTMEMHANKEGCMKGERRDNVSKMLLNNCGKNTVKILEMMQVEIQSKHHPMSMRPQLPEDLRGRE